MMNPKIFLNNYKKYISHCIGFDLIELKNFLNVFLFNIDLRFNDFFDNNRNFFYIFLISFFIADEIL